MKTFLAVIVLLWVSLIAAHAGDCRVVTVVKQPALAIATANLTAGYVVDAAAYQFRVSPSFNNYPQYEKTKFSAKPSTLSEADYKAIAKELLALMEQKKIITSDNTPEPLLSAPRSLPEGEQQLLLKNCLECHGLRGAAKGGFWMVDYKTKEPLADLDWTKIDNRINSEDPDFQMPPPNIRKQNGEEEVQKLKDWISSKKGGEE